MIEPYPVCAKCGQDIKSKRVIERDEYRYHPGCVASEGDAGDLESLKALLFDREDTIARILKHGTTKYSNGYNAGKRSADSTVGYFLEENARLKKLVDGSSNVIRAESAQDADACKVGATGAAAADPATVEELAEAMHEERMAREGCRTGYALEVWLESKAVRDRWIATAEVAARAVGARTGASAPPLKWAEARAAEGCFWSYSDGWVTVYDSEARHIMLARLEHEQVNGEWLSVVKK